MSDIPEPLYRKIEIPLIRLKDKRLIGTLTVIRTETTQFYDESGRRHAVPTKQDTLIFTITNTEGEQVSWNQVSASDVLDLPLAGGVSD